MEKLGTFTIKSTEVSSPIKVNYSQTSLEECSLTFHIYRYHNAFVAICIGETVSGKVKAGIQFLWLVEKGKKITYPESTYKNGIDFGGYTNSSTSPGGDFPFITSWTDIQSKFYKDNEDILTGLEKFAENTIRSNLNCMSETESNYKEVSYGIARFLSICDANFLVNCPHSEHWIYSSQCQILWKEKRETNNLITKNIKSIILSEN